VNVNLGKVLSLLVAIAYAVLAFRSGGVHALGYVAVLLLPLALIWFPEDIGELTGFFKTGYVNVQTPAIIISFIGWFLLVGLPIILICIKRFA